MKKIAKKKKVKRNEIVSKSKKEDYWKSWSSEDVVRFYTTHRNSTEGVYDSEKYYLRDILYPGISICDVGCGAGGFFNILRRYQPDISYTGVDISEEMINNAKKLYPEASFEVSRGDNLNFADGAFDLVISFGVLHMDLNWRDILKECWRATQGYFLFDLRLVQDAQTLEDITVSYQKLAFEDQWNGLSIVPYVVVNVKDAFGTIMSLVPESKIIRAYGYFHPVSRMTVTPYKEVCMTMFRLKKTKKEDEKNEWNVPLTLPEGAL
jgi:ubiquinone/menaquinone biosynthesis C-methylase UbiE